MASKNQEYIKTNHSELAMKKNNKFEKKVSSSGTDEYTEEDAFDRMR